MCGTYSCQEILTDNDTSVESASSLQQHCKYGRYVRRRLVLHLEQVEFLILAVRALGTGSTTPISAGQCTDDMLLFILCQSLRIHWAELRIHITRIYLIPGNLRAARSGCIKVIELLLTLKARDAFGPKEIPGNRLDLSTDMLRRTRPPLRRLLKKVTRLPALPASLAMETELFDGLHPCPSLRRPLPAQSQRFSFQW